MNKEPKKYKLNLDSFTLKEPKRIPMPPIDNFELAFLNGLVKRGEVAAHGEPIISGMTHEFTNSETPSVVRRRFNLSRGKTTTEL